MQKKVTYTKQINCVSVFKELVCNAVCVTVLNRMGPEECINNKYGFSYIL